MLQLHFEQQEKNIDLYCYIVLLSAFATWNKAARAGKHTPATHSHGQDNIDQNCPEDQVIHPGIHNTL